MTRLVSVILVLVCQIGLSMQTCPECKCCKGSRKCDFFWNCVDGCIDGYHGDRCTNECLENCKNCTNGYGCTECKPGYYTDKCNLQCGKGCINNTCSLISGECTCKSINFTKGKCDACLGLRYGDECNNTCPSNCGSCISDTECTWCVNTAYYGSYCQYRCSPGCDEGKCRKYDGYCSSGCKPGYIGDKCDACSPGTYGNYCELPCPENCYKCFSASNCTVCKTGFYGETCTKTCSSGCYGNCSLSDGLCLECRPGLFGDLCDTCKNGTYGVNCSNLCSTSCLSDTGKHVCDDITGHCLFGCKKGFSGNRCDKLCSSQCINITCNQITAECLYGCIDGFKGSKCLEAILLDREGILIGSILGSFLAGGIVVGVIALVAFKVWKRRNRNNKETDTHGYENTQVPDEYRTNEDTHDSDAPVTYEDLKSRDERLYSELPTSQQISPPATDYVNCS